jgi:hypothetical protein
MKNTQKKKDLKMTTLHLPYLDHAIDIDAHASQTLSECSKALQAILDKCASLSNDAPLHVFAEEMHATPTHYLAHTFITDALQKAGHTVIVQRELPHDRLKRRIRERRRDGFETRWSAIEEANAVSNGKIELISQLSAGWEAPSAYSTTMFLKSLKTNATPIMNIDASINSILLRDPLNYADPATRAIAESLLKSRFDETKPVDAINPDGIAIRNLFMFKAGTNYSGLIQTPKEPISAESRVILYKTIGAAHGSAFCDLKGLKERDTLPALHRANGDNTYTLAMGSNRRTRFNAKHGTRLNLPETTSIIHAYTQSDLKVPLYYVASSLKGKSSLTTFKDEADYMCAILDAEDSFSHLRQFAQPIDTVRKEKYESLESIIRLARGQTTPDETLAL